MPTWAAAVRFKRDLDRLTPEQRAAFLGAVSHFVTDLKAGPGFRPGLRVKRVQGTDDVWETTWASDGRATRQYGPGCSKASRTRSGVGSAPTTSFVCPESYYSRPPGCAGPGRSRSRRHGRLPVKAPLLVQVVPQ